MQRWHFMEAMGGSYVGVGELTHVCAHCIGSQMTEMISENDLNYPITAPCATDIRGLPYQH